MSGLKDQLGDQLYEPHYNGPEYTPSRDHGRLSAQTARVFDLMKDARWRTLENISVGTGDPVASISAQLRHLRKERFGGHTVNRRHIGNGLYEYQVVENRNGERASATR